MFIFFEIFFILDQKYVGELDPETKKRHGNGTYLYPNSFFQYTGQWNQNIKSGKGMLFMKDGGTFEVFYEKKP